MATTKSSNSTPKNDPTHEGVKAANSGTTPLSKKARLQARLEKPGGASTDALTKEFGWQRHTLRAAISGLRKAGHDVQRGTGGAASVYALVPPVRA